jgi:hypothetical protein
MTATLPRCCSVASVLSDVSGGNDDDGRPSAAWRSIGQSNACAASATGHDANPQKTSAGVAPRQDPTQRFNDNSAPAKQLDGLERKKRDQTKSFARSMNAMRPKF